jgi:ferredoxin
MTISFQREKCIGCGYCYQIAKLFFIMSKKDGKAILLRSIKKNNFFILKIHNIEEYKICNKASLVCPIKIIHLN